MRSIVLVAWLAGCAAGGTVPPRTEVDRPPARADANATATAGTEQRDPCEGLTEPMTPTDPRRVPLARSPDPSLPDTPLPTGTLNFEVREPAGGGPARVETGTAEDRCRSVRARGGR